MTASKNLVWITLESIRYDHTSLAPYKYDTTPSLRRIADRRGWHSFSHCITHGNWTGTSSASILTGTVPPIHGIYGESDLVLSSDIATVPELLPDEYTSLSLISNPNAGPAKNLDRGFDEVKYVVPSRLREDVGPWTLLKSVPKLWTHGGGITTDIERHKGLSSYMMVNLAERFAATQADPFFMYLHLGSSHHPYLPPAAYVDRFTDDLPISPRQALEITQSKYENIHELIAGGGLSEGEWQAVKSMYDAVVAHVDHCVGHLVDEIHRHDSDTIVVITADHGDLLGEYDLAGHKFALHDGLIRVPLLVYGLDGIADQTGEVIQHIDVLKTILSRIGVEDDQLKGVDLTHDTRDYAITQRSGNNAHKNLQQLREYNPAYELPIPHLQTLTSLRSTDFKLLYSEDGVELFALPDEMNDVKAQHPTIHATMGSSAQRWLDEHETRAAAKREQELDPDIKEHLADMGYLI